MITSYHFDAPPIEDAVMDGVYNPYIFIDSAESVICATTRSGLESSELLQCKTVKLTNSTLEPIDDIDRIRFEVRSVL